MTLDGAVPGDDHGTDSGHVEAGEVLIQQGEPTTRLYVVISGRIDAGRPSDGEHAVAACAPSSSVASS